MDTSTKWMTGLVTAVMIAFASENIGSTKKACETYQGYKERDVDASVIYVFDPATVERREKSAKYYIQGNPQLRGNLKRGQRYCVTYKEPLAPWAPLKDLDTTRTQ
jgi:hypothetical protein